MRGSFAFFSAFCFRHHLCYLPPVPRGGSMVVRQCMTHHPATVSPQDTLATAQEKMTAGHFRRVPVVHEGALVGILTDRDVRRHVGVEDHTRVGAAMTETPLSIS